MRKCNKPECKKEDKGNTFTGCGCGGTMTPQVEKKKEEKSNAGKS